MRVWDKVLIIDDSTVYSQLMQTLLAPYAASVLVATGVQEAIAQIEANPDVDLALCDYLMRDGDGLEVLRYLQSRPDPKPRVVMVTGYPSETVAAQAIELGAVDCLQKPTSVRRIVRSLRGLRGVERRQVNPRWRCPGQAHLLDHGDGYVIWDVYNISSDGAFLETKGPIPVGSVLDLRLQLGGQKTDVKARVVRVQEPSWMDVGGVGVEFIDLSDEAEAVILAAIESSSGVEV